MRRLSRIILWCILPPFLIALAICTAGEISQRILVHRAESLLSDIHSLRLHRSTWSDAQRLMARWGRSGRYENTCTSDDCFYVITLQNGTVPASHNLAEWPSWPFHFLSQFRLLPRQWGGGLRLMQGMFLVQNGLVVRSGLAIDMTQSPFANGAQPACCGSELIISTLSRSSLGMTGSWQEQQQSHHPDYTAWKPGGCTFCLMGRVTYADSMPAESAANLSNFQLSCATRWSSCLTLEDLDPAAHAWHLYEPPWGDAPEKANSERAPTGCSLPLYALGRDANSIVSAEALEDGISLGTDTNGTEHESSRVRVIAAIKGASPWAIDSLQRILSSGSPFDNKMRRPTHLAKHQHYLLILGKDDEITRGPVSLENCGIVREDEDSDQEVRQGIALDDRLIGFEPTFSIEGFVRHQPEPWDHQ